MSILDTIIFEDPNKVGGAIKATIHKSGKLGFSSGAEDFMKIVDNAFFKIGFNDSTDDGNIYMVPCETEDGAFKISKAGQYYYINLKNVFDKRGIDYKNKSYIYDIKKEKTDSINYFILTKRKK
ncbi:hypothetical protein ATB99_13320 [Elizabethkingia meningoseptica]|uniref:hypothetical protein n=1 Tax=Elizabethkingia meningoseptica TaxID=238 RepID=UPI0003763C41|nr:hypothetical protein [Elizabethkingia meningoseptica]AQX04121.1 hypothetical protein BBD33_02130 [Elizabethkingia meningoseptica]AQX46162.1 hypothetical protein B5G46_02125 [Elizabethkingia meningoseptica]KUY15454.1 hypothetical protein ATB99_13320 [Elizabethkingia meningoseptica]OPB69172.1 hypothetical protein BAY30_03285 [Elizabethkingia meningoseptica]SQG07066.1 Uncharacterised protein [Elizabethkingia meningoseptica]